MIDLFATMEQEPGNLSATERALWNLLKQHGIDFSDPNSNDFRAAMAREFKDFFHRITHEGLQRLFEALYQKGYLHRDNQGWYRLTSDRSFTDVSIVGRITAGRLSEAVQADLGYVRFEGHVPNSERLIALEVVGDSMIGDQIEDGDCVLLKHGDVQNGQIGAVVVDGETTLKRVYRQAGGLRLVPSNPLLDVIYISADEMHQCRILGKLEAVISKRTGDVRWFATRHPVTEISLFLN